ncbi:DUF981 family protein [Leptolyngbya sp. FACHB-321]|uniref:DUF981 family protein n=1 Tax=Leptolyngbya sp. FACHB-321 TaxID=2692807 RepID=UPI0018EF4813|nr:DUF981 family protein [Leptolyngbya sp. FACHB-321]
MFINYISLVLANLASGITLLAGYLYFSLGTSNQKRWIPGFGVVSAVAIATGLHMTLTWSIVGSFDIAFGEITVLFGILFVGTSLTLTVGWELFSLGIYGIFAGLVLLLIGFRIIDLGLTQLPLLSGIGFILVGLGGIFLRQPFISRRLISCELLEELY